MGVPCNWVGISVSAWRGREHHLIDFQIFVQQVMELTISGKSWRKAKTAQQKSPLRDLMPRSGTIQMITSQEKRIQCELLFSMSESVALLCHHSFLVLRLMRPAFQCVQGIGRAYKWDLGTDYLFPHMMNMQLSKWGISWCATSMSKFSCRPWQAQLYIAGNTYDLWLPNPTCRYILHMCWEVTFHVTGVSAFWVYRSTDALCMRGYILDLRWAPACPSFTLSVVLWTAEEGGEVRTLSGKNCLGSLLQIQPEG